jgi:sarcosine oxidase subunit alpha
MARTYGLLPGTRAVFSIGDDLSLEAALDLAELGIDVLAVADLRIEGQDKYTERVFEERGIPYYTGWVSCNVSGRRKLKGVTLVSLSGSKTKFFSCDLLVASAGQRPLNESFYLAGAKMVYDEKVGFFLPKILPSGIYGAGRVLGYMDEDAIENSGTLAGLAALNKKSPRVRKRMRDLKVYLNERPKRRLSSGLHFSQGKKQKGFVCFDEDVTVDDVLKTMGQGFDSVELCKRFSTAGMGPSQSSISGVNLPLLMALEKGLSPGTIPQTKIRPPLRPVSMATLAGKRHDLVKETPFHRLQKVQGGHFIRAGDWYRVRHFNEHSAAESEIEAVHNGVAIMDVSSLGKFRIFGTDAEKALQRLYISNMEGLNAGKLKYSAMCNEDGCVIDDGVVVKIQEGDYYFTTSSARASHTIEWFRYHTRYEDWDYQLTNLTDGQGALNLAGPKARHVLENIVDCDISPNSFPYMNYREMALKGGIPVRILRLGFVGELSFEIHCPASAAEEVWKMLWEAGQKYHILPFGLEAQNVLRLEKGHIIIGEDTELRTSLHDVGLGFLWAEQKKGVGTVGGAALGLLESQKDRIKLVGFKTTKPTLIPPEGSLIVDNEIRGHVTSCRYSHLLKEAIGLALVEESIAKEDTRISIYKGGSRDELVPSLVVRIPFYDPEGKRLRM